MAELNNTTLTQEPVYLNYGADQIDQQAFLDAAANNVLQYVNNLTWSAKRKLKFLNAYSDIMSKGIIGANNKTGQWAVDLNSNIDLESMDRKDQEMYHEAAYYILQLMKGITPKAKEEEKKKEENLTLYDLTAHTNGLQGFINNKYFGGRSMNIGGDKDDWNLLDERNSETGVRGTANRAKRLAEYLLGYSDSLEEGKYNFEGSPYKDLNDLKSRIANAVTQLNTGTDIDDADKEALNQIGLDWRDYFNDGSGDIADEEGHTYAELAKINQAAAEEKIKEEAVKAEANRRANAGVLSSIGGIHATDAMTNPQAYAEYLAGPQGLNAVGLEGFNIMNLRVLELLNRASTTGLSNNEKRQLGNFLYYIRQNNPHYNLNSPDYKGISDEDWAELNLHKNLGSTNRAGYVRLPWEVGGRYTYADDKGNIYFLKPLNKAKIVGPAFNRSAAYDNYKNNFLKGLLQLNNEKPVLSQDTDILISDMTSMLGDIVSLGGGYAGAAGGVATLLSDLYGDIRRGKDTWSTIKNLGANVAWGAAGLIPGAKLGKLAKNAARIYATLQSAGILMNDEVQLSWKNLIAGKPITAKDFENFKWTLHAITGGTNAARGHFTERNVAKQVKTNNKPTIETKAGAKPITQEQVNKINKVGGRKGLKAAEEAFEKTIGAQAKEGTFNFLEEPRAWYNPARYSQRLRNWVGNDERLTLPKVTQSVNAQAVNRLLEIDKAKPIIGVGNPFSRRFWTEGGPNRGGLTWAVSPYRINQLGELLQNNNSESSKSSNVSKAEDLTPEQYRASQVGRKLTNIKVEEELPENVKLNRETINNYKNIMNNNFSANKLQSGSSKLAGSPLQVVELSDGTFNVLFKGKIVANERNLIEILKSIRDLIKNTVLLSKSTKSSKISAKEMGKLLKEFKAKGWLKQGGQINNFDLDKTISEFLNKLK